MCAVGSWQLASRNKWNVMHIDITGIVTDCGQNKFFELLTLWTTTTPSFIVIWLMPMEMAYTMYSLMASEAVAVIQELPVWVLPSMLWYSIVLIKAINDGLRGQTASDQGQTSKCCSWPRGQQPLKVSSWLAKRHKSYSNLGTLGSRFWRRREQWMSGQSGQWIFRETSKL